MCGECVSVAARFKSKNRYLVQIIGPDSETRIKYLYSTFVCLCTYSTVLYVQCGMLGASEMAKCMSPKIVEQHFSQHERHNLKVRRHFDAVHVASCLDILCSKEIKKCSRK